jgi:hypothetical protein
VEVPSQPFAKFSIEGSPNIFKRGGFEVSHGSLLENTSLFDSTCGIWKRGGSRYRASPADALIQRENILEDLNAVSYDSDFVDIRLNEIFRIPADVDLARKLASKMADRDHVQLIYRCKLSYNASLDKFICAAHEVTIGYIQDRGDLLRFRIVDGVWTVEAGSGLMEKDLDSYSSGAVNSARIQVGYDMGLNAFIRNVSGFAKRTLDDRAEEEGKMGGYAATQVVFTPRGGGNDDYFLISIAYGLPEHMLNFIKRSPLISNGVSVEVNGVNFYLNKNGEEKSYSSLIDERIFIFVISNKVGLAKSGAQAIDFEKLRRY